MIIPQIVAAIIIVSVASYFLYDIILHAKGRGGNFKQILIRVLVWLLVFIAFLCINLLINEDWVPGKWLFRISF